MAQHWKRIRRAGAPDASGRVVMLPTGSFHPDGIIAGIGDDGRQIVGSLYDEALTGLAVSLDLPGNHA